MTASELVEWLQHLDLVKVRGGRARKPDKVNSGDIMAALIGAGIRRT